LSTLTKIVIVLLTLASFFLCASVVVYVGTSQNYKEQNSSIRSEMQVAQAKATAADDDLKKYKEQAELDQKKLSDQITSLNNQITKITSDLTASQRDNSQLLQRVDSLGQSVEQSATTAENQRKLFEETQAKLKDVEKKLSDMDTMNKQLTDKIDDQMANIDSLEKEKKRLLEDKSELEARLNEKLMPGGKTTASTRPVTIGDSRVRVKPKEASVGDGTVRDINLQGTISELKESMATISIGGVDGVKAGMEFFVIRGDQFICKVKIVDVADTQAAGKLELVQQNQPKVGDVVTTNL
jgi:chromosome segregation ATPase